jgi:hypothetical protein
LVYTIEGCRETFNFIPARNLYAQFHGKLSQLSVTVSWSDGSPAYEVNVTVMPDPQSTPFVAVFRTGKDGRVEVPIPLNQEFRVNAGVVCSKILWCELLLTGSRFPCKLTLGENNFFSRAQQTYEGGLWSFGARAYWPITRGKEGSA